MRSLDSAETALDLVLLAASEPPSIRPSSCWVEPTRAAG